MKNLVSLFLIAFTAACSPMVYTHGIPNFSQVGPSVYRSGQISSDEGWAYIRTLSCAGATQGDGTCRSVHVASSSTSPTRDPTWAHRRSALRCTSCRSSLRGIKIYGTTSRASTKGQIQAGSVRDRTATRQRAARRDLAGSLHARTRSNRLCHRQVPRAPRRLDEGCCVQRDARTQFPLRAARHPRSLGEVQDGRHKPEEVRERMSNGIGPYQIRASCAGSPRIIDDVHVDLTGPLRELILAHAATDPSFGSNNVGGWKSSDTMFSWTDPALQALVIDARTRLLAWLSLGRLGDGQSQRQSSCATSTWSGRHRRHRVGGLLRRSRRTRQPWNSLRSARRRRWGRKIRRARGGRQAGASRDFSVRHVAQGSCV